MKYSFTILAIVLLAGCAAPDGQSSIQTQNAERITVAASFYPLAHFAKQVASDLADVRQVLPAGAEPHHYEPSPREMTLLTEADVVLLNGAELMGWEERAAQLPEVSDAVLVTMADHITLRPSFHEHHHEHEEAHGEEAAAFEWAGMFSLQPGDYRWTFAKVNGFYADPSMGMVILPAQENGSEAIEHSADKAGSLLQSSEPSASHDGDILVPREVSYQLHFDDQKDMSSFTVRIAKAGNYVFFTEHMPFEFEADEHFFKNSSGEDIEPLVKQPEAEEGHHHGANDPHFWLDPMVAIKEVELIRDALKQADPANAEAYDRNAAAYVAELRALDADFRSGLQGCPLDTIIVGHDSFGYTGERYGFSSLAIADVHGGELSARVIADITDAVNDLGIKHVFVETLTSPKLSETIARETGAQTLTLDTVHGLTEDSAEDPGYIPLMQGNLRNIRTALQCP